MLPYDSRMRTPLLVLVGALIASGCAKRAPASSPPEAPPARDGKLTLNLNLPPNPRFLKPSEIVARMQSSPISYSIEGTDAEPVTSRQALAQMWPPRYPTLEHPCVTGTGTPRRIGPCAMKPEAQALLEEAEPHYDKKQYAEAGALAAKAAAIDPDSHLVWLYVGDCAYFSGDARAALEAYDKALEINPVDYQGHFFRGNALARLGRTEEAKRSFARSLVLKPRNDLLLGRLEDDAALPYAPLPEVVAPSVLAWRDGESIHIRADPKTVPWFMYGMCKGFWLGEPAHRQELTGSEELSFSVAEEMECLLNLLVTYQRRLTDPSMPDHGERSAPLDRLEQIVRAGFLRELVIFELGTRVHPQLTVYLDDGALARMERFVLDHVFAPRSAVPKREDRPRGGDGERSASLGPPPPLPASP